MIRVPKSYQVCDKDKNILHEGDKESTVAFLGIKPTGLNRRVVNTLHGDTRYMKFLVYEGDPIYIGIYGGEVAWKGTRSQLARRWLIPPEKVDVRIETFVKESKKDHKIKTSLEFDYDYPIKVVEEVVEEKEQSLADIFRTIIGR